MGLILISMHLNMWKIVLNIEGIVTNGILAWLFIVHRLMFCKSALKLEFLVTNRALEWPLITVPLDMSRDRLLMFVGLGAYRALKWSLITVDSEMDGKLAL